jgi:hypothetical protein
MYSLLKMSNFNEWSHYAESRRERQQVFSATVATTSDFAERETILFLLLLHASLQIIITLN